MNLNMLGAVDVADKSRGLGVASVTVSPPSITAKVGDVVEFTAVAVDEGGRAHRPSVVSWTSTGGAVDPSGRFVSAEPGTFQVTARVGQSSGVATVVVERLEEPEAEEDDPAAEVYDDLEHPRQGIAAFHAAQEEIDFQADSRLRFRGHYPDLAELEGQPYNEAGAALWAGFGPDVDAVGAAGMPTGKDLAPYLLTKLPTDPSELDALYQAYLRALDQVTSSFSSVWHPVSSGAVKTALLSLRQVAVEEREVGRVAAAAQLLASAVGFVNAKYRTPTGDVDWKALDTPVNAGIFETAAETGKAIADAARSAGDALSSPLKSLTGLPWWGWALLFAGLAAGGGYLLWLLIGRAGAREVVLRRLGGSP